MKERTIAEAAIEVLKDSKEPMTAAEITQAILEKGLYQFNTKDQVGMVRRALRVGVRVISEKMPLNLNFLKKLVMASFP